MPPAKYRIMAGRIGAVQGQAQARSAESAVSNPASRLRAFGPQPAARSGRRSHAVGRRRT